MLLMHSSTVVFSVTWFFVISRGWSAFGLLEHNFSLAAYLFCYPVSSAKHWMNSCGVIVLMCCLQFMNILTCCQWHESVCYVIGMSSGL